MSTVGNTPVEAYEAFSEKTRPVCLYSGDGNRGLSVTIYWGRKKGIKGVAVYDANGDIVETVGKVPREAIG